MEKEIFPALKPWLRLLCYWPRDDMFAFRKKLYVGLFIISVQIPSFYFILTTDSTEYFFTGISENLACSMALVQTFVLGFGHKQYKMLIEGLEEMWTKSFTTKTIGWQEFAKKVTNFTNIASKALVYIYLFVGVVYMPVVGIISIYDFIKDPKNLLSVGFYLNLYNIQVVWKDLRYFLPLFVLDVAVYVPTAVGYGAHVVLIPFLSNYFASYLKYIQLSLEAVYLEDENNINEKVVHCELRRICFDHQNAMKYAKMLNSTFQLIYLAKLMMYTIFYCILFFIFTLVDDKLILMNSVNLFLIFQFESWFICYYGDKLMTESLNVANVAYNVKWYNTSVKTQKYILMIITACHKPLKVSAAGFTDICIETYGNIMKSAYSYFTIMTNMYHE